jgi:hypothetical protein
MEEVSTAIDPQAAIRPGYGSRQRVAIIAAVSLLVMIMVGSAFATGVYVGNNRQLAPGTFAGAGAPPRQGQPGAPQQGQPGQNLQPLAFDTQGVFQVATATALSIQGPDGPRSVNYDQKTQFARPDGTTLKVTDLRPGMPLGIRLRPATTPLTADAVTVLGAPGGAQPGQAPAGR